MQPKLILLDIDGTLLAPGAEHSALPDAELTHSIGALRAAGVHVTLATGRMFPGTITIANHLGIELPLICQQGASTHALDGALEHHVPMDTDLAHELSAFAETEGWPYAWLNPHRYLVSHDHPAAQYFAAVSGVALELHAAPRHAGLTPGGIDIISTAEHAPGIAEHVERNFGDRVQVLNFTGVTAVLAKEASKGLAGARLAAELGVAAEEVLAIGDSANDASMLDWAGMSATPEHGDRYAKAAAKQHLQGPGIDGVKALLAQLAAG